MYKNPPRRNKKSWMAIVAVIAALGMIFSVFFQALQGPGGLGGDEPAQEQDAGQHEIERLEQQAMTLEQHIEDNPDPVVMGNLADIYYEMHMYASMFETEKEADYLGKAAEYLEKSLDKDPDNLENHLFLLEIYDEAEKEENVEEIAEKAESLAKEALEEEPDRIENYLVLLEVYRYADKEDKEKEVASEGEELILEVLEENPEDSQARLHYSTLLLSYHQDMEAAVEQLEKVLEIEPEESPLYNTALQQLQRLGGMQEVEVEE